MLKQTKKAGAKEFFLSLLVIAIIATISSYIRFILPSNKVLGDILGIILFCIYGFNVMCRYGAVYTYTIDDDTLKINRTIGKRNKELQIPISCIKKISNTKPKVNTVYNFSRFIFSRKNTRYIEFEYDRLKQAVLIETDAKMLSKLKIRRTDYK